MGDTWHRDAPSGRSRILLHGAGRYVSVACLLLAGCDALTAIEDDGCGNRVINEDEDCDGLSLIYPDAICGAADEANACFFVCSNPGETCPDGWGCGSDGRCRRPKGEFVQRNGPSLAYQNFAVDDVDGDGALDLVGSVGPSVSVRFGDGGGLFESGFDQPLPTPTGAISFGQFTNDTRMDMIAPVELGFFSLLGTANRTLEPYNYASFPLPVMSEANRIVSIEAYLGDPGRNSSEAVFFVGTDLAVFSFDDQSAMPAPAPGGMSANALARDQPRFDLDGDSLTDLVLLYRGHDRAYFFESSGDKPLRLLGVPATDEPTQGNQLLLPVDHVISEPGGLFADVDMDGDVDLVIAVRHTGDNAPRVAVAYQAANGVFDARAGIEPLFCLRGGVGPCVDEPWPLAAADFNHDQLMDYVFSDGIALAVDDAANPDGVTDSFVIFNKPPGDARWDHVAILDINADGQPDVATASQDGPGVTIFLNAFLSQQIVFNPFPMSTSLPIRTMTVGDYDGDLLVDLALVEEGGMREPDRISVIFGTAAGGSTGRVDMGAVGDLQSLDTGSMLSGLNGLDVANDLLFMARPFGQQGQSAGPVTAAVMFGDSSRKLISPFLLPPIAHYPAATVIGQFGHPAALPPGSAEDVLVVLANDLEDQRALVVLAAGVGQGDARWQANYIAKLPAAEDFNGACALFTAGPLRDGDDDALVGVDFGADCAAGGVFSPRLLLAENLSQTILPDGPPPIFMNEAEFLMYVENAPELPATSADLLFSTSEVRRLELVDMNGDGARDLLLVASDADNTGALQILWNSDVCGGDRLCDAARTDITITNVAALDINAILDATTIRLDTGSRPALAVLTDHGVIALRLDGDTLEYSEAAWLMRSKEPDGDEDGRLRVADVDADGLEDLIVNGDGRVHIGLHVADDMLGLEYKNQGSSSQEVPQ